MTSHVDVFPRADQPHEEVAFEVLVEDLTEEEQVRDEGALEDDGHVACVEQLDGVGLLVSTGLLMTDSQLHTITLEVDHNQHHSHSGNQVEKVGRRLTIKGLAHCLELIAPRDQEVEERNDGSLELSLTARGDDHGAERLPEDGLSDVASDEDGDT